MYPRASIIALSGLLAALIGAATALIITGHAAELDIFKSLLLSAVPLMAGVFLLGKQNDAIKGQIDSVERNTNGKLQKRFDDLHTAVQGVTDRVDTLATQVATLSATRDELQ